MNERTMAGWLPKDPQQERAGADGEFSAPGLHTRNFFLLQSDCIMQ